MSGLRIIGAGLPRTGTRSLKTALERLLGAPCYHMTEVFARPSHIGAWHRAAEGEDVDLAEVLDGYAAAVDYPSSAFWPELAARFPDAPVLLSHRDPASWWTSANDTILQIFHRPRREEDAAFLAMVTSLFERRFTTAFLDRERAIEAAARHVEHVRATVPAHRLEWAPGDGWEPLCRALGVPVPDEPYPHENTTAAFRARLVNPDPSRTSG